MGMISIVTGHDGFVKNGLAANIAAVRAVGANGGTVRQQEEVGVGSDLVVAFCAFKAINVEQRLATSELEVPVEKERE